MFALVRVAPLCKDFCLYSHTCDNIKPCRCLNGDGSLWQLNWICDMQSCTFHVTWTQHLQHFTFSALFLTRCESQVCSKLGTNGGVVSITVPKHGVIHCAAKLSPPAKQCQGFKPVGCMMPSFIYSLWIRSSGLCKPARSHESSLIFRFWVRCDLRGRTSRLKLSGCRGCRSGISWRTKSSSDVKAENILWQNKRKLKKQWQQHVCLQPRGRPPPTHRHTQWMNTQTE